MQTALLVLLGVTMLAVLGTLLAGVVGMANDGAFNKRWGNRLMRWRVTLQGVALVLFVLAMLAGGG